MNPNNSKDLENGNSGPSVVRHKVAKIRVDLPGGGIGDEVNGGRIVQLLSVVKEPELGNTQWVEWAYVLVELPEKNKPAAFPIPTSTGGAS